MVEDDQEILDWGNEDDELQAVDSNIVSQLKQPADGRNGEQEDDAVSLGDDEDEDIYTYRPTSQDDTATNPPSTPHGSNSQHNGTNRGHDIYRESSITSQKSSRYNDSPSLQRTQSLGKMVHALPPKPVVALPPPAHSPPTQNTLASTMVRRERKSNGHGKLDPGSQGASSLPPDWEERYPRDGSDRGPYYYNIKTHISTWVHPGLSPATASQDNNKNSGNTPGTETQPPGYSDAEDRASTSPRLGKRRSSPAGPLSYEDRHYRPNGDTAVTGPSKSVDRRDLLSTLPPRPVSPRPANSRRDSRVSSPPPRQDSIDQERGVRSRRDRSPLPDDGRDKSREYIQLSAEDRTWIPTRNDSPPSLPAGRNSDSRSKALRGRRDRSLLELPPQSIALSQGVRNDNEWTASRPRSSAPRVREASPVRRYSDADAYVGRSPVSPPRQRNRNERSPSPNRLDIMDPYGPGSVPQRRAREDDSYDVDVKRRRTDRSPVDPIRGRELINTREARASNSSNFTPVDSMELSRSRKRQPLPPQSARFREASKKPAPPEPIAPVPGTQYSGVRNQPPHSTRDPPTGPSGRGRNRVDSGIVQAREIDVMELDHLPLSRPPPARIASSVAADKGIGSPSMPPTGPRAMSKISGQPHPLTPPSATQELSWQRPPPPHLRQDIYSAIAGDQQDIPSRSARHSRKVTGSNSTPLGENRRQPPEPPRLDIPTAPVADRYRQLPTPTHLEVERNRYVDDYSKTSSRSASHQPASPIDRLKILPPVNEPTTRWPAREDLRSNKDRGSPILPHPPVTRTSLVERDIQQPTTSVSERSSRISRFGPERGQALPVADAENRQWLTREEAERSGLVSGAPTARTSNVRPPSPPSIAGRDQRDVVADADRYVTGRGYQSSEDHMSKRRLVDTEGSRRDGAYADSGRGDRSGSGHSERPSLEGRLSYQKDYSFAERLSDSAANPERPPSPVKGRRKGRLSEQAGLVRERKDLDVLGNTGYDYPPTKQGTTLLDRLTEPGLDSAGSIPSLRDRVDPPLSGFAGLPPRPPVELSFDSMNAGEGSSKGERGPSRRRNVRMRKGRKGGA